MKKLISLLKRQNHSILNLRQTWQFYVLFIIVLGFIKYHSVRIDQDNLQKGDVLFIDSKAYRVTEVIHEDGVAHYHTRKVWDSTQVADSEH